MKTATAPRRHVKHVHVELDFATWARLKRRLGSKPGVLSQKVRELIVMDLEDSKQRPPGA